MRYQNYTYRTGSSHKRYVGHNTKRKKQDEYEYIPAVLFFRIRLLICIMILVAFITADKYILKEKETTQVFQKIEENVY